LLVHEVGWNTWEAEAPLNSMSKNVVYEQSRSQHHSLAEIMAEEGVKVFELTNVIREIVDSADEAERKEIIEQVWGPERNPEADDIIGHKKPEPTPDELKWEHIIYGYPPYPLYDPESDQVLMPDAPGVARANIYARDTSMGTPIGHVISRMRRRKAEPKVSRLVLQRHPELNKNVNVILDADTEFEEGAIEGGDTQIIDEETIAVGVGQRSDLTGLKLFADRMFEKDTNRVLRSIVGVKVPGEKYSDCFGHLDTIINYPDKGKALVTPYVFISEHIHELPKRKLLLKLIQAKRGWVERNLVRFGSPDEDLFTIRTFLNSGETIVYGRDSVLGVRRLRTEKNFLDWLVSEEKIDKDGIIMVAGKPQDEHDVMHVVHVLQEQFRQAANIVTVRPGLVLGYQRNARTNRELEEHGVRMRKLQDTYLDLGGGPRCLTCPLDREPV
jgi:arginine deiminase